LDGRAALVTGGGTGIGLACAARLAADGAVVTICGRRREALEAAVAHLGGHGRFVVCDVQDEEQVAAAVAAATEPFGALHMAVVNAGGGATFGPIVTGDAAGWRATLDLNVIGSFLTIKHAAPAIARSGGGAIVAISSIAGSHTHRHLAAYSVSKAALDMLVRNAADELGEFGVRVNAVRPGLVPTDASQPLDGDPATRADYLAQMPLGRTGTVDEVAAAVRFLAGDDSAWITGQSFGVDGGHSLRRGPDLDGLFGAMFRPHVEELMTR
jgi:NAD(P)-dependent dehydrogenase (short-subunit alcohol dehydrogenase family)